MMEVLAAGASSLGIALSPGQLSQFEAYYRALTNARMNLTTVTDYEGVQKRHFLESLAVLRALYDAEVLAPGNGKWLLDLGSGGGFPGLPMKIADPSLRLTLLEATVKKAHFLETVVAQLLLEEVDVVAERAEVAAHDHKHRETYDVVTARAVAAMPTLVELALPFLRMGGYLAAPKGAQAEDEVGAAARALELCGGEIVFIGEMLFTDAEVSSKLVLVRKVATTPPQYPRRPGIPTKRPLG